MTVGFHATGRMVRCEGPVNTLLVVQGLFSRTYAGCASVPYMCNVLNAKYGSAGTWPVLMPGDVTLDCVGKPDGLQMPLTVQLYHADSLTLSARFTLYLDAK